MRRLSILGPGAVLLKAAAGAIMFDGNDRWAAARAGDYAQDASVPSAYFNPFAYPGIGVSVLAPL